METVMAGFRREHERDMTVISFPEKEEPTLRWEYVPANHRFLVSRARVPGGWLVFTASGSDRAGLAFYPDPRHEWDGTSC